MEKRFTKNKAGRVEQRTLTKIHFNESFFSKWSNGMTYLIGLIYTDGNIFPGFLDDSIEGQRQVLVG